MIKKYALVFLISLYAFPLAFGQTPWINEIHYDNSGSDVNEGVEIAVPSGYTCTGTLILTPYNGNGGVMYNQRNVNLTNGTTTNGVTFYWSNISAFQNGAPDGIALSCDGTLIQFLSYEGTFTATDGPASGVTSVSIGVQESSSTLTTESLQLQGTGCQYSDFTWGVDIASTHDAINTGQTINCSPPCTDEMDWANIQFPTASPQNITFGDNFDVYTQAVEPGVTDADATAPGIGVEAWIGYSSTNNDPSTSSGWTWIAATYNTDVGANDEHVAEIGSGLAVGTYYYASRYRLNGCGFTYGGTGGPWNNDSVQLIVNPRTLDWVNLQSPATGNITTGTVFDVFGQVYEPGVTDTPASQGLGIEAEIGYTTTDTDPSTWPAASWGTAGYNPACGANCGTPENNDEYFLDLNLITPLTAGTYYYASRFRIDGGPWVYGGYNAGGGGFWTATFGAGGPADNVNGQLIVTDPVTADVVITEIMYNSSGTDDEWIEICNISGSAQDLSNYTIEVAGTVRFTFGGSVSIADGACITIAIGDNGNAPYNPDCPFVQDYGSPAGTNFMANSPGGAGIDIELLSPSSATADIVNYDDADGADGTGPSLHVIDATQDNSDTSSNWQEVIDGGSPGINSLVSPCTPIIPEINVEGFVGGFPDIFDGDVTPQGTDNTLFAQQIIGNSQLKSYRIQNLGAADLTISNIYTAAPGAEFADFTVGSYSYPITIAPGADFTFDITFSPTAAGQRDGTLYIDNNDADENPYNFAIRGSGICAAGAITISPSSGPAGTIVNVTGTNFGTVNTAASIDGIAAAVTYISPTEIEVTIPTGANPNDLEIIDESNCLAITFFTVLTSDVSSCEGASGIIPPNWNDLLITGVYDNTAGSCHYLELFNPTGAAITLTGQYEIGLSNNYATTTSTPFTFNAGREPLTGTVQPYSTYVVRFGNQGDTCNDCPTIVPDETIEDPGFGINGNSPDGVDRIVLIKNFVNVDLWGNDLYGAAGYVYTRSPEDMGGNPVTATAPTMFWDTNDWASQGTADCFGFQYQPALPPTVTLNPSYTPDCDLTASFTVSATEGYDLGDDTRELAYQWFYHAPGDAGWTAVTNGGDYSGATSTTLSIINVLNYYNYQYYCQIREDDSSCFISSDASRLELQRTVWDGSSWTNATPPDINTIAVIDGNYNTSGFGNITACNLIINAGYLLNVDNSTFVNVQDNVIVNGDLTVQTRGAFVQIDDSGTFSLNAGGSAMVTKTTTLLSNWYDYTYWSSPVVDETVDGAFPNTPANRRFWFNAANYLDEFAETGNDNTAVPGQDDIDDNGDDWQVAGGASTLTPGLGYAATSSPAGLFPGTDISTFEGEFNNGIITTPIIINGFALDNDWNFIGNPYASAIDFDDVFSLNSSLIDGAAFLWSHATPPDGSTNGNEVLNFAQSDYAIITVGSGNTAGGDGVIPAAGNYIPSGQGFFVTGLANGNLTFNNAMRRADTSSNNQFFEAYNPDQQDADDLNNRLWINLTSDNGVFNQILIAYVEGATNENDGMAYDAERNLSSGVASIIYSFIDSEPDEKYAIQGKEQSQLTLYEVIPLGFKTTITEPTLYKFSIAQLEGEFLSTNTIYLNDHLMGISHDLSLSDYRFTSDVGEFNERFEIVFKEGALSLDDNEFTNGDLVIIEGQNDNVLFKLLGNHQLKTIEILDLLGRTIYELDGEDQNQITHNLSGLSQATYVAKVTLTNGKVIIKKAVKRK